MDNIFTISYILYAITNIIGVIADEKYKESFTSTLQAIIAIVIGVMFYVFDAL